MQEIVTFFRSRQPVNLLLVAVNVVVYLVFRLIGDTEDVAFMLQHGAAYTPLIVEGREYYRLVTCMFLHFGLEHILYNMLILIFLGDTLEKMAGRIRYLTVYLAGGIAGNILSVWMDLNHESYAVSAGASGAIFAVLGALVCAVVVNRGNLMDYSGRRLIFMAVLLIAEGWTSENVDYWAHLGGFAAGFLIALLFRRKLQDAMESADRNL